MQTFFKISDLQTFLTNQKLAGQTIGFVPTMGALHEGHGSLVKRAKTENDLVVVSIFVNPTQFNNASDLKHYPRSIEADTVLLEKLNCDVVFIPDVDEIYDASFELPHIDLGHIDKVMEGEHRPGHFQGVVQVVYRLFQLVQPDKAYFGLKDFQQVAVIRFMTNYFQLPVEIIAVPTLRHEDGLAMSSRNLRLTPTQRQEALAISQTLLHAKELAATQTPDQTKQEAVSFFKQFNLELEYFEIVDPVSLQELHESWVPNAVACIVAYCGEIRLIDNMELKN